MKYISLIFLFIGGFASAQSSLLYEISGNGIKHKAYLFGTVHVQDEKAFNFNDSVFWAIQQCDKSAFELDFNLKKDDLDMDTSKIRKLMEYATSDLIPTIMETYTADSLANRIVQGFVPVFQTVMQQQFAMGNKRSAVVDQYLQNYSRTIGNEIIGIETYAEQFNAILGSDFNGFTDLIMDILGSDDLMDKLENSPGNINKLVDAYASLDFESLCNEIEAVGDATDPFSSEFYGRIFTDRNQIMFDRTRDMVKEGPIFIAVGCGHLCSGNGLVQQYRNAGYTVRAIDLRGKAEGLNVTWESVDHEEYTMDMPVGYEVHKKEVPADQETEEEVNPYLLYMSLQQDKIYTAKGTMSVSVDTYYEAAEEAYEFNWEDFNEEGDIQYEETAEEAMDEAVEVAEDEIIYLEEVEDEPEEVIYLEEADDAAFEELPAEEEIIYYEDDSDEEVIYYEEPIEYSDDAEIEDYESSANPFNPKDMFTEEMEEYFSQVGQTLKSEMAGQSMAFMGMAMMAKSENDTFKVEVMGQEVEVYREFSLLTNKMSCNVVTDDGGYTITITGDPAVLRSEETLRILRSFKIR